MIITPHSPISKYDYHTIMGENHIPKYENHL